MKNFNIIYRVIFVFFLSSWMFGCGSGEDSRDVASVTTAVPTVQDSVTVVKDIAYGDDPQQKYDVYLPKNSNSSTTKTIVLIHGGGWTSGDKEDMNLFVPMLRQNFPDLAIVNINYVLAGPGKPAFPNQREDIEKAFEHIKAKAATYKITTDFGILGTSAGAHLGMLYGFNKKHSSSIKLILNIVGPVDFTDSAYLEPQTKELQDLVKILEGEAGTPETTFLQEFSPVFLVHKELPPVVSFYGNTDPLIPNSQHEELDKRLKDAQAIHDLTVYDGGHANWDAASLVDFNLKLKTAIANYLK